MHLHKLYTYLFTPFFILAFLLTITSGNSLAATYSYQSPNYSVIFGSPGLTTSMHVTGSFDISGYLSPNLISHDISGILTQYSFNNGIDTFTQANSLPCTFYVSTDSQGNITTYVMDLRESPAPAVGNPIKYLDIYNPGWTGADSGNAPSPGSSCASISPNNRAYTANGDYGTWVSPQQASTVTTQAVNDITTTTATGNGNITDLGSPNPTQHGVCWSTSANPTIALPTKTEEGAKSTTGAFTSDITGLSPITTYYVKAYATNTAGTAYGDEVFLTTACASIRYVNKDDGTCSGKNPCHTSIQDAIDNASTGACIWIARGAYTIPIVLDAEKRLALKGGWDSEFEIQTSSSTKINTPDVPQGALIFQMLDIVP